MRGQTFDAIMTTIVILILFAISFAGFSYAFSELSDDCVSAPYPKQRDGFEMWIDSNDGKLWICSRESDRVPATIVCRTMKACR